MPQENYFVEEEEPNPIEKLYLKLEKQYRKRVDPLIIYKTERWVFTVIIILIFIYRLISLQGFYVIAYMQGLLVLQLTVQFFTPLGIPNIEEDEDDHNIVDLNQLPTHSANKADDDSGEFKPMIRSVSEFKYWQSVNNSSVISLVLTMFKFLDLPVFWPFLLAYFIGLVIVTFTKLWNHSRKYNYNFFDSGKVNYNNKK